MEKIKLLTIAVIGLLLINLATVGFLLLNNQGHKPPTHEGKLEPKEIIIDRLQFDVKQQKEYDKLIYWHHKEIEKLDGNIRQAKNELYATLNEPEVNMNTKDSLISDINSNQKQIEETHFKHFEDIKKLCNKDQIEYFNKLTEELGKIFAKQQKPPRRSHD